MKTKSRYVFTAALAGMALNGVPALMHQAKGALLTEAAFTFESDFSVFSITGTNTTATGGSFLLYASYTGSQVSEAADSGTGTAYGIHTFNATATGSPSTNNPASKTVWSTPAGNGSLRSLSANHWGAGDMYSFTVTTADIMNVLITFDQTSSGTGPKAFALTYSAGAVSGTAGTYPVYTGTSFGAGASNTAFSQYFDLSSITGLTGLGSVTFNLVDTDTTTATGGTDRIDNFVVSGTAVPEPAGLALVTVASAAGLYRRRKTPAT